MPKFSVDYNNLSDSVLKKSYKLSDVEHKLEKVAFDVVRFKDSDIDELWQIQSSDDGEYIVALYNPEDSSTNKKIASSTKLNWDIIISESSSDLNILYKGDAILKIASSRLGIPLEEINLVKKYLPNRLSENKALVKALLNEVSQEKRKSILAKYPELF